MATYVRIVDAGPHFLLQWIDATGKKWDGFALPWGEFTPGSFPLGSAMDFQTIQEARLWGMQQGWIVIEGVYDPVGKKIG